MSKHHCHAIGCTTDVPPKLFMCKYHWSILPAEYQKKIWANYRPGQEVDKNASKEYLRIARICEFIVRYIELGYGPLKVVSAVESCKFHLANARRRLTGRAA